jgi:hypothetical protein
MEQARVVAHAVDDPESVAPTSAALDTAAGGRRVFLTFLAGILLVQAAWILALPAFRGIDEFDHVYKAAAVARGQWTSSGQAEHGRGGLVRIPGDIVSAAHSMCASYEYTKPDDCVPVRRFADGTVEIASSASAYNPTYYLIVGTLARPFHGDQVDYVIRAVTALACALLLAWAAAMVASWGRTRWPLVAFTLGLTPVLVYSTAIASPNGIAYGGAALLWSTLLNIVRRDSATDREATAVALGAVALSTMHPTGPMFAFLILVLAFALRPARAWWSVLATRRRAWLAAATAVLVVAVACVAWIGYAHPGAIGEPADSPLTVADDLTFQVLWLLEAVAVFPTVTEYAPTAVYALWGVPLLVMLALLLRTARGRRLVTVAGALALLVVIPATYTAATYADTGLAWQGRYSLPLWLGVSGLAALTASSRREAYPTLVPVAYAMAAAAVALSVVHVGLREASSGVTDPPAAHIPGGFVLMGFLAVSGALLPMVVRRQSPGRRQQRDVVTGTEEPAIQQPAQGKLLA